MLQVPDIIAREILSELIDTGNEFDASKVHLFANDIDPNRNTLVGAFDPPLYSGYAASSAIVWGLPLTDDDGNSRIIGDTKQFTNSGGTPDDTIYGYFVTDTTGAKLLWSERFAEPVHITGPGDGCVIVPVFRFSR